MGEALLEKETLNLPQIIEILGERPHGLKEHVREYLEEVKSREAEAAEKEGE